MYTVKLVCYVMLLLCFVGLIAIGSYEALQSNYLQAIYSVLVAIAIKPEGIK